MEYDNPVRTLRGVDRSGVFCAALANYAASSEARREALRRARKASSGIFTETYQIH